MHARIILPAILIASAFLLKGCEPPSMTTTPPQALSTDTVVDPAHNSRNALDWAGVYRGVLPCADCTGIETVITLRSDLSYRKTSRYLGKDDRYFSSSGRFVWDSQGGIITLSDSEPEHYRVAENQLIRLTGDGQRVTGPLADHYLLPRMEVQATGIHWRLVELQGQPIPDLEREAYLLLNEKHGTVVGSSGCNTLSGRFELRGPEHIRFEHLASTMMLCAQGMDTETALLEALEAADGYSLEAGRLTLSQAGKPPLARFEAIHLAE